MPASLQKDACGRPIVCLSTNPTPGTGPIFLAAALRVVPGQKFARPPFPPAGNLDADDQDTPPPARKRAVSLETYLREINETSLLSAADEHQLAVAIGGGDNQARDRMVRANLRLVVNIARGYTGKGLGLQDLIEEGNLGLLRAVEGFDPAVGTRFSTYASYWIKQSIKRALINTAKTIRIPAYMVELLSKWRRASTRLAEELGRTPTPEEIARVLGLPARSSHHQESHPHLQPHPADRPGRGRLVAGRDGHGRAQSQSRKRMVESDNLTQVMRQLQTMDAREATVLRMRFGLDDNEPRTLKEIGESLGLTRERVRQIETEALGKLADSLNGPPVEEAGTRGQVEKDRDRDQGSGGPAGHPSFPAASPILAHLHPSPSPLPLPPRRSYIVHVPAPGPWSLILSPCPRD